MADLTIAGVTHLSDLYPNVKYKIRLLSSLKGFEPDPIMYDLGSGSFYESTASKHTRRKFLGLIRNCWGHLLVFIRLVLHHPTRVYICYPGIFLANLFALWPARFRPQIYLDAFISLYDTAINDRKMMAKGSWRAKLLYRLERHAFTIADYVITDTRENAQYYSGLFSLPPEKFIDIPLCIPPFPGERKKIPNRDFTCLFVGSLVPLQGIEAILEAAYDLKEIDAIKFKVIGDGQDATFMERFIKSKPLPNLVWERGFYPTSYIVEQIDQASLCLGIFGATAKAERVFPYKLYYYCRAGKAFITRKTPCVERLSVDCHEEFLLLDHSKNESVAGAIRSLYENPDRLHTLGNASEKLFNERFSEATIERLLLDLLDSTRSRA